MISKVTVFCGTGSGVDVIYRTEAEALGKMLACKEVGLIYGGAQIGLMGVVADAALAANGSVTGIMPQFLRQIEPIHPDLTSLVIVETLEQRKQMMIAKADAFIVLPGGFGTFEELFEVLTLKYVGLHEKPIFLVNIAGYFDDFGRMVDRMVGQGFTPEKHRQLYTIFPNVDALAQTLN